MQRITKMNPDRYYNLSIGNIDWFRSNDIEYLLSESFIYGLTYSQPDNDTILPTLDNHYIYGGIGKTSSIRYLYPNAYYKNDSNWLGYYNLNPNHEVVIIDNIDNIDSFINIFDGIYKYKHICSFYPFMVNQNGRNLKIRPKKIIIISEYSPQKLFKQITKYGSKIEDYTRFIKIFQQHFNIHHINEWMTLNLIYFDKHFNTIQKTNIDDQSKLIKEQYELKKMSIEDTISNINQQKLNINELLIDDYALLET